MTDSAAIPRFKDYAAPGGANFDRARNLIQTAFQQIDINLNAASPAGGFILPIAGDFLYVDADPSASNGVATLQLNLQQDASVAKFYIQPGFALNSTFTRIRLDWSAQPGLFLRLLYSTGDRVVPAFAAQSISTINNAASNPARVQEQGIVYGASYKSSTAMAANTPDNIWAAASNVNGAVVWSACGQSSNATAGALFSLLCKATAPASAIDGDVIASNVVFTAGFHSLISLQRSVRLTSGKRGDFVTSVAETFALRSCLYNLL